MPVFDMIVGPWPMEKMANQLYFNDALPIWLILTWGLIWGLGYLGSMCVSGE